MDVLEEMHAPPFPSATLEKEESMGSFALITDQRVSPLLAEPERKPCLPQDLQRSLQNSSMMVVLQVQCKERFSPSDSATVTFN